MELFRDELEDLKFRIHVKPNQEIKYLNAGNSHTPDSFKAITRVFATALSSFRKQLVQKYIELQQHNIITCKNRQPALYKLY